jgi:uncharacterized protein (DUF488 family)
MHPTLFTLGYEGLTIEAFIARLQAAQVKTIVDVRELPLSRKKGFSKSAFCAALSAHGIAYLHAPALGCPKPIRNQYKADGNWQTYTRDFLKYIQTRAASVRELVKIAQATPACLVCFEADFSTCHRTYVASGACSSNSASGFFRCRTMCLSQSSSGWRCVLPGEFSVSSTPTH